VPTGCGGDPSHMRRVNFAELREGEVHGDGLSTPSPRSGGPTLGGAINIREVYRSLMYTSRRMSLRVHKKRYHTGPGAGNRKPEKPGCRSSEGGEVAPRPYR
jgi:hypothetical protein